MKARKKRRKKRKEKIILILKDFHSDEEFDEFKATFKN